MYPELAPIIKLVAIFVLFIGVSCVIVVASTVLEMIQHLQYDDDGYRRAVMQRGKSLLWSTAKVLFTLILLLFIVVSCSLN